MYVSDSRRQCRDPEALTRAQELIRRQQTVLKHYAEGCTQREIAERMAVSRGFVERLLRKLNIIRRPQRG